MEANPQLRCQSNRQISQVCFDPQCRMPGLSCENCRICSRNHEECSSTQNIEKLADVIRQIKARSPYYCYNYSTNTKKMEMDKHLDMIKRSVDDIRKLEKNQQIHLWGFDAQIKPFLKFELGSKSGRELVRFYSKYSKKDPIFCDSKYFYPPWLRRESQRIEQLMQSFSRTSRDSYRIFEKMARLSVLIKELKDRRRDLHQIDTAQLHNANKLLQQVVGQRVDFFNCNQAQYLESNEEEIDYISNEERPLIEGLNSDIFDLNFTKIVELVQKNAIQGYKEAYKLASFFEYLFEDSKNKETRDIFIGNHFRISRERLKSLMGDQLDRFEAKRAEILYKLDLERSRSSEEAERRLNIAIDYFKQFEQKYLEELICSTLETGQRSQYCRYLHMKEQKLGTTPPCLLEQLRSYYKQEHQQVSDPDTKAQCWYKYQGYTSKLANIYMNNYESAQNGGQTIPRLEFQRIEQYCLQIIEWEGEKSMLVIIMKFLKFLVARFRDDYGEEWQWSISQEDLEKYLFVRKKELCHQLMDSKGDDRRKRLQDIGSQYFGWCERIDKKIEVQKNSETQAAMLTVKETVQKYNMWNIWKILSEDTQTKLDLRAKFNNTPSIAQFELTQQQLSQCSADLVYTQSLSGFCDKYGGADRNKFNFRATCQKAELYYLLNHRGKDREDNCLQYLSLASEMYPNDQIYYYLGRALYEQTEEFGKVRHTLKKCLEITDQSILRVQCKKFIAKSFCQTEEYEAAQQLFMNILNQEGYQTAEILNELGELHEDLSLRKSSTEQTLALDYYQQSLALNPHYFESLFGAARIYKQMQSYQQSKQMISRAKQCARMETFKKDIYALEGDVYREQAEQLQLESGRREYEMLELARNSYQQAGSDEDIKECLARVLKLLGQDVQDQ